MKKIILVLLALTVALSLFGCAADRKASHREESDDEEREERIDDDSDDDDRTDDETDALPEIEANWRYDLISETSEEEYTHDDGTVLATGTYERPLLGLACDKVTTEATPAEMQRVCDSFNRFFDTIYNVPEDDDRYYYCSAAGLGEMAKEWYDTMSEDSRQYFSPYFYDITLPICRIDGDLAEVQLGFSTYTGGAHGGSGLTGYHFDLQTGEFFGLADLTDDPEGLAAAVSDEIIRQIADSGEAEYYFGGYEETIRNRGDYNFTIGEDGLTFIFGEYEIGSYAMGILEFTVSYDVIAPLLNERGVRLLGL